MTTQPRIRIGIIGLGVISRFYVDALAGSDRWPITVLTTDPSPEGRLDALRTGPYGRCVYRCDNDVADHQQTVMNFADGLTATLSTSGLTGQNTRTVQLTGAAGELTGHMGSGRIEIGRASCRERV